MASAYACSARATSAGPYAARAPSRCHTRECLSRRGSSPQRARHDPRRTAERGLAQADRRPCDDEFARAGRLGLVLDHGGESGVRAGGGEGVVEAAALTRRQHPHVACQFAQLQHRPLDHGMPVGQEHERRLDARPRGVREPRTPPPPPRPRARRPAVGEPGTAPRPAVPPTSPSCGSSARREGTRTPRRSVNSSRTAARWRPGSACWRRSMRSNIARHPTRKGELTWWT
jgi:hypothetical protein